VVGSIRAKIANLLVPNIAGITTIMKTAAVTTVRSFAQGGSGKRTELSKESAAHDVAMA
jgi:hypothetical protein